MAMRRIRSEQSKGRRPPGARPSVDTVNQSVEHPGFRFQNILNGILESEASVKQKVAIPVTSDWLCLFLTGLSYRL
jgi:hypothetical protein